jgi:peptidoglycan hydrolase-like protein with peptidoglycan-binding domain
MTTNTGKPAAPVAGAVTTVATVTSKYPINVENINSQKGVNDDVKTFQKALGDAGFEVDSTGVYDYETKQAVIAFQVANGIDGFGIVDSDTLDALFAVGE